MVVVPLAKRLRDFFAIALALPAPGWRGLMRDIFAMAVLPRALGECSTFIIALCAIFTAEAIALRTWKGLGCWTDCFHE